MVLAQNATSVVLTTMQSVHQEQAIAWRYIIDQDNDYVKLS